MPPLASDHDSRIARARLALDGLSIGDAFGERFFDSSMALYCLSHRQVPPSKWRWSDDTAMAVAVFRILELHHHIEQDALADLFATRYDLDPGRGYGGGAHRLLRAIASGADWRPASRDLFGGEGSYGNGGAMRVAPVGAYFADDPDAVVAHAIASAEVTHAHPDGQAGAVAVAVAAAFLCANCNAHQPFDSAAYFRFILNHTPDTPTRAGIDRAASLDVDYDQRTAIAALGNGVRITSSDTVPLCLWLAARHHDSFEDAMWNTVACGGDVDTTAAIVGGLVACSVGRQGIPSNWLASREPLS